MTSVPTLPAAGSRPEKAALRAVTLEGPTGRLEALLNEGSEEAPYAALVCHPHPLGGGTMHNKVAYHAMKVLNAPEWDLRWPVLRFNFRGTGLSEGEHHGAAESGDVIVALDWLADRFKRPVVVVGFSFGAAMALNACCDGHSGEPLRATLRALAALGLPALPTAKRVDLGADWDELLAWAATRAFEAKAAEDQASEQASAFSQKIPRTPWAAA